MKTTLTVSVPAELAKRTRSISRRRGFKTTSEYLRFLLEEDDVELIGEDELVARSKSIERLQIQGKLISANSISELF